MATNLHEPPVGAPGETGFWGVAGMYLVIQVGGTIPIPLWVVWQSKLGFGTGTLTLVFAIYTLGTLVSLLLIVPLSDRVGRRPVLILAVALAAVSTVFYLVADTVLLLFVARFISGMAVALTAAAGAAALRELEPGSRARRASLAAAAATMGGLALGPLLAGFTAEYARDPLRLVFWIYLALLSPAVVGVLLARETVLPDRRVAWRPGRIALPRDRSAFALAAATAFCAFALLGLYSSLVPTFLRFGLHERNHAVAGLIVSTIFLVGAITQLLLFRMSPRQALCWGLPVLLVGLALIELGLWDTSLGIFVAGTIAGGLAVGLLFMGSLAIVNQIAEPDRRAQVLAAYFVCTYAGLAVPAIAVGEAIDSIGANKATLYCAIAIAALAFFALNALLRRRESVEPMAHACDRVNISVTDNPSELRYELHVDGELAGQIRYRRQPGAVVLVHTDVEPRFEGHGLGSRLVQGALDDLRARGLALVPLCPFVADFIGRHPEYADLVTTDTALPQ